MFPVRSTGITTLYFTSHPPSWSICPLRWHASAAYWHDMTITGYWNRYWMMLTEMTWFVIVMIPFWNNWNDMYLPLLKCYVPTANGWYALDAIVMMYFLLLKWCTFCYCNDMDSPLLQWMICRLPIPYYLPILWLLNKWCWSNVCLLFVVPGQTKVTGPTDIIHSNELIEYVLDW